MQRSGVKLYVSVSLLPLYCMTYITLLYNLIYALILILRHLILITFYALTDTRYHLKSLCFMGKKNSLEPLDRPPYKIQRIVRGINYESIERLRIYLLASDTSEHLYYLYDS